MKTPFTEVLSSKWSIKVLDFVFANPIFMQKMEKSYIFSMEAKTNLK
jgi:hypothetical protein